jgi:undecaprenyl-diphosphatase
MSILSTDDARPTTGSHRRHPSEPGSVLAPRTEGLAARLGDRWSDHSPVTAFSVVAITGLVVLAAVIVGLGLLLVHVLLSGGLGRWDASVNEWFVTQRTTTLNAVTRWGSDLGATLTIVGVAFVVSVALAIARRWEAVQFVIISLVLEVSVFLISTILVNRARPDVHRLDISPPTSSYPSGHTAAAIVLYVGLALVVGTLTRNALVRAIAWILAVALPIVVGLSRLYRGMHHPTDVLASVTLGIGALLFGLLAVRTASAVSERRRAGAASER